MRRGDAWFVGVLVSGGRTVISTQQRKMTGDDGSDGKNKENLSDRNISARVQASAPVLSYDLKMMVLLQKMEQMW